MKQLMYGVLAKHSDGRRMMVNGASVYTRDRGVFSPGDNTLLFTPYREEAEKILSYFPPDGVMPATLIVAAYEDDL